MFWRRAQPAPRPVDFSGHFERSAFAIGDHAIANTYNGTVIQQFAADTTPQPTRRRPPQDRAPRDPVELLGRSAELRRIDEALGSGSASAVHGAAGVGKTVLLKHVARRVADEWPDGVLYANVGGQPLEDVLQWLFTVFWDTGDLVYVPGPLRVRDFLVDLQALVVLDDVDHDSAGVERLLDGAPACGFAFGAAQPVLAGRSYPLGGLDPAAARGLFARVLGRALADTEQPAIDAFVAHVEGFAGYVVTGAELVRDGVCPAGELVEQAGAQLARRRLFALPAAQQELLALLAELAPAPVPAGRLGAGAEASLERLRAAELVERHSPRYTLSGPLGPEELRELPHVGARDLLRGLVEEPDGVGPTDAASIVAALAWAQRAGEDEALLEAARVVSPAMVRSGRPGAWGSVLEHGLAAAHRLNRPAEEALFLHDQGTRLGCLGDREHALGALTRARDIRRRLGDEDAAAVTEHNLRELFGSGGFGDKANGGGGNGGWPPRALLAVLGCLALLGVVAVVAFGGGTGPLSGASETATPKTTRVPDGKDTTKPTITLLRPRDGERVVAGAPLIAAYQCRDGGQPAPVCTGTVPAGKAIDTTEGVHTFRVHARDDAGNVDNKAVTYHAAGAPSRTLEIVIQRPADGATFRFGTAIQALYRCRNASTCVGDVKVGADVNSRPGTHDFTVRATGTDGTPATKTVTYTVEARQPQPLTVSATAVPDPATGRETMEYGCSGGTAPLTCTATLDGKPVASGTALGCGAHSVDVHAADAAGKTKDDRFPIDGGVCG